MFFIKELKTFFLNIRKNRYVLSVLIKNDFIGRFSSTYFGVTWLFLHNLLMIAVMGFVMEFGLRSAPSGEIPFYAWVIPAQAAWAFFSEGISFLTGSLRTYSYLVTKTPFSLSLIALIKLCSTVLVHLIFILVVIIVLMLNHIFPTVYWLQVFYYLFASSCLLLGLGWLLSALSIFVPDVAQIINIILSFGVWLTPIYWNMNDLAPKMKILVYINPLSYIVEGYRASFLYNTAFFLNFWWSLYFWLVVFILLFIGSTVFRKLQSHFADIL